MLLDSACNFTIKNKENKETPLSGEDIWLELLFFSSSCSAASNIVIWRMEAVSFKNAHLQNDRTILVLAPLLTQINGGARVLHTVQFLSLNQETSERFETT